MTLLVQHIGRYSLCARQVNNLAVLIEVVKFTHPIRAYCNDINIVGNNFFYLKKIFLMLL